MKCVCFVYLKVNLENGGKYECVVHKKNIFNYVKIKPYSSQHVHVLQQTSSLE